MFSALQTQGPGSPRSSPSHTISRPIPTPIYSDSAVTTPTHAPQDSLMGVGGDVQEAFAQGITAAAWHPGYRCPKYSWRLTTIFFYTHNVFFSKVHGEIWEMTCSSLLTPSPAQCRLWWKSSTQVTMHDLIACVLFVGAGGKGLFLLRGWKWDWEHCGFRLWARRPIGRSIFRFILLI